MNCNHNSIIRIDDTVEGFDHPMLCEGCNHIVECEHPEIDHDSCTQPVCVDCLAYGVDVYEPIEYDKYESEVV